MHIIKHAPVTLKDTRGHSFGNYNQIIVLHEKDLKGQLIKLRGFTADLILIPSTFDLKENKDMEILLRHSLTPHGQIKFY